MADPETQTADVSDAVGADMGAIWDAAMSEPAPEAEKPSADAGVEPEVAASPDDDAPPASDEEITDQSADEDTEEPDEAPIGVPKSWSAEQAEHWAKIPRATQEYILRRENDASKAIQERAERANAWRPVEEAIAPLSQRLAAEGVQPAQFLQRLVQAHQYLEADPTKAIAWLAKQYGATPPNGDSSAEIDEFADPKIAALERRIAEYEARENERHQQQVRGERSRNEQLIQDFASKNEHFETVRGLMAGLLQSGAAKDLQDAYEQAVWAHPETRKAMSDKQEAERQKMAQVRAAKAQKAAAASSRPAAVKGSPAEARSIDDTLAEVYDRATAA